MAGVSVAAEWQLQHESYYRKPEIYSMQWQVDLSRNKIACAPFGGPISGILLSSTRWDRPGGRLIGWNCYRYNIHGEIQEPNISLGSEFLEQNVVECVFWGNGMVCLTEGYQIFCISDFKNPNPCKLEDPLLEDYPLCIAVIEPQHTMSGNVEVLLGVNDYILVVDEDGIQKVGEGIGPLQKMVLTQNGKFLASFTHDGRLLVTSTTDYKEIFSMNVRQADDNLRSIRSNLPEAVEACIDAAGHEFVTATNST
ncbi:hypothetical protein C5167_008874 [Papaver somniferum]|uniref:Vps16 N-terminal domain-containing protein n=1 Tax=Papaver somniferum TaxID=3469 RepID=A0A4Y7JZG5_PAPSO|nr:hypothetical protein C5167_008874 [Papaver somniferum]